MSDLGVQVWSPNLPNVQLVPGKVAPVTNDNYGKPGGGLWTSTWDEDYGGGWLDWCIAESFRRPPFSVYLLTPDPGARVYVINSPEALLGLASRYPLPPRWPGDHDSVDWVAVGLDYDAVHLTEAAHRMTRLSLPVQLSTYTWDCESTCWYRWVFTAVEHYGMWSPPSTPCDHKGSTGTAPCFTCDGSGTAWLSRYERGKS